MSVRAPSGESQLKQIVQRAGVAGGCSTAIEPVQSGPRAASLGPSCSRSLRSALEERLLCRTLWRVLPPLKCSGRERVWIRAPPPGRARPAASGGSTGSGHSRSLSDHLVDCVPSADRVGLRFRALTVAIPRGRRWHRRGWADGSGLCASATALCSSPSRQRRGCAVSRRMASECDVAMLRKRDLALPAGRLPAARVRTRARSTKNPPPEHRCARSRCSSAAGLARAPRIFFGPLCSLAAGIGPRTRESSSSRAVSFATVPGGRTSDVCWY